MEPVSRLQLLLELVALQSIPAWALEAHQMDRILELRQALWPRPGAPI